MGCLERTRQGAGPLNRDPRELGGSWKSFQRHGSVAPAPALADVVDRYWTASWDYPEPLDQLIVPSLAVHATFWSDSSLTEHPDDPAPGAAAVRGVASRHRRQTLTGRGAVVGVAFRPGLFRAVLGTSVSTLRDRVVDAREVFGADPPDAPGVSAVEEYLLRVRSRWDTPERDAASIVERIAADPTLTRVDDVAGQTGLGVRALQRMFSEHVGIGPKWVIRRCRLQDALDRLEAGERIDWASLAAELGYADQPHFVRDFTGMFGESPTHYARRY